ncbi:hypothetical protein A7X57_16505 [Stenotrophomonas maltophilia]|nr:hypothetical protein A7X57_16505 [Stenotrophomonas maltophilia]
MAFANALSALVLAESATERAAVTLLLVELSCLPDTASVLVVLSVASATPVIFRLALALLRTSSTVPLLLAPTRTFPDADVWLISPESVLAFASALSALVLAESATERAAVTLLLVAFNCLPDTASVLDVLSVASATPVIFRLALALLRTSSTVPLLLAPTRTFPEADVWLRRPESTLAFDKALSALDFAVSATVLAVLAVE